MGLEEAELNAQFQDGFLLLVDGLVEVGVLVLENGEMETQGETVQTDRERQRQRERDRERERER